MSPRLYLDEESKTKEALLKFEPLKACTYSGKNIGSSGQEEAITCDCVRHIVDGVNVACGEDSDCINRLTSVECTNDHNFTCAPDCQNQRFQKRQYAKIDVFLTEKKGYGVRAGSKLSQGQFIYEYIGEVIDEKLFRKRMLQYDHEGIKHFYFMMLQKDEFIDATKKGSLARFCNHSCNPNAYVDKWVVGKKLRMGIFAKRDIIEGEEICFDYNVDRYGATAQPCYCGEPNCIGFLGGKTQTDSASLLPQALAEALSIVPAEEKEWLKSMRKSGKKLKAQENDSNVNEEFIQSLPMKPLAKTDVPKVMSALMLPNQEPLIIEKIIERIYISDRQEDADDINKLLIRMHGYKAFSTIIKEVWKQKQNDTLFKMIEILLRWPAMSKNKITSSQIEDVMTNISKQSLQLEDEQDANEDEYGEHVTYGDIHEKARELLSVWNKLLMAYRIRKATEVGRGHIPTVVINRRGNVEDDDHESDNDPEMTTSISGSGSGNNSARVSQSPGSYHNGGGSGGRKPVSSLPNTRNFAPGRYNKPFNGHYHNNDHGRYGNGSPAGYDRDKKERDALRLQRVQEQLDMETRKLEEIRRRQLEKKNQSMEKIIEEARRAEEEKRRKEEEVKALEEQEKQLKKAKRLVEVKGTITSSGDAKERSREAVVRLWTKAFAVYVPNMIKKHEKEIGRDNVKACAQDIVKILSEKEVTRHGTAHLPPKELKDDKLKKVREYTRDYMKKWLHKFEEKKKSHKLHPHPHSRNDKTKHAANGMHSNGAGSSQKAVSADALKNLQSLVETSKRKQTDPAGSNGYPNKRQH